MFGEDNANHRQTNIISSNGKSANIQNNHQIGQNYESGDYDFINPQEKDNNDNIEQEQEENRLNDNQFTNQLLFHVQELGSTQQLPGTGAQFYVPGAHCLEALKDIIKFCKNDDPRNQVTRYLLGKWETFKTDLMPLFQTQTQDKTLSFEILILMHY